MTAMERMQAAIDKLEALQEAAPPGPWETHPYWSDRVLYSGLNLDRLGEEVQVLRAHEATAAELVATIERTVTAQLAILRFAVEGLYDLPEFVMLANAILGDDS